MMKKQKKQNDVEVPIREQDPFLLREREKYANPLPSREFLLAKLAERGVPVFPEELSALLEITEDETAFFMRRLRAMERDGEIVINRKGAVCVAEKLDLIKGRIQGHAEGYGFLVPDDGSSDLFLGPREMHKALHGDRVLAREVGVDRRGRREAKIVEILERVNTRLVGRLRSERGILSIIAEDKRINQDILVAPGETGGAEPGQVVTIELISQPEKYAQPIGRVIEVLGNYADPGMEIEIALRKHNLPHVFDDSALEQAATTAQKVRKKDWKTEEGLRRQDIRDLPLVTIDGETAKDFDDAVFAEPAGKGWRLLVAIADVSAYVRPNDALDVTALERGNSVYFPRRVIPMLPEALSNGICSLNPQVERLTMVCDMQVSPKGKIKKYTFYPAVMFSQARLTYTQVAKALADPMSPQGQDLVGLMPHLKHLDGVFRSLLKARRARGAIDFETVETQMIFNDAGKIESIVPVHRNDAHRLIEECMLAANVCAADFLGKNKHTALYRVHEGPTLQKLENLRPLLQEKGLTLGGGDKPTALDYAVLMEQVKTRPDMEMLQTVLLRSLQQAVYTPEREGHFGLAYEAYTHFTSPIRRYPDLLVHRAIKAVLAGRKYKPAKKWVEVGAQCSATERRADEASRDVQNWLKCYFMRERIGEVFVGTVTAVTSFGLFVLLDDLYVEGLLHVTELGQDYFHFEPKRHEIRGERTGRSFRLSDRIGVKVARVDIETSKIDFVLVNDPPVNASASNNSGPVSPSKSRRRPVSTTKLDEPVKSKPATARAKRTK